MLPWIVAAAVAFLIVPAKSADAVPVFARKYQTSCQTCHIVFPKLNAFGEAFRLRGYRMPGETADMVKEPPVSLGAPAYKRLWPQSIWPGEISSSVPLAVNVKMAYVNTSTLNEDGTTTSVNNDLQFPQEVNLFGAGTLGDHVSYLAEVTFGANSDGSITTDLEHARIQFDSPFGPEDLFHFRLGKFAPNLFDGFQEMWISTDAPIDSLFNYDPIGVNGGTGLGADGRTPNSISLPGSIQGIEGYGMIPHRALWVAGLANGVGPSATDTTGRFDGNNAKDVYARSTTRLAAWGWTATPAASRSRKRTGRTTRCAWAPSCTAATPATSFPAHDGYRPETNIQDMHFVRTGVYASLFLPEPQRLRRLHARQRYAAGVQRRHARAHQLDRADFHAWFTQADYVFYPWLQAPFRYETVTPADSPSQASAPVSSRKRADSRQRESDGGIRRDLREGDNHLLNALLRFAF